MRFAIGSQINIQSVMKYRHITHLWFVAGFDRAEGPELVVIQRLEDSLLQLIVIHGRNSSFQKSRRYTFIYPHSQFGFIIQLIVLIIVYPLQ
ncbi:hypothetical protein D3C80_1542400 [compost metagenome]